MVSISFAIYGWLRIPVNANGGRNTVIYVNGEDDAPGYDRAGESVTKLP